MPTAFWTSIQDLKVVQRFIERIEIRLAPNFLKDLLQKLDSPYVNSRSISLLVEISIVEPFSTSQMPNQADESEEFDFLFGVSSD